MGVFSYDFIFLLVTTLCVYYTVGQRFQWQILLAASAVFYFLNMQKIPLVLVSVSGITYCGALVLERIRRTKGFSSRTADSLRRMISGFCILLLILGRQTDLFALLGNSYFTLRAISYLVDVDRDPGKRETNYFKYLLFLIYFPAVSQGPLNRYHPFQENFQERRSFRYTIVMHGAQRFLWGAFKKLVIAERLSLLVTYVYGDLEASSGLGIIAATGAYAVQLYADFSGYMDMMGGISSSFGIVLPENFSQPYFSLTVAEFWRRWHITLGQWFRDYVMFQFVMSRTGRAVSRFFKRFGKHAGKNAAVIAGTVMVWMGTSLWHGFGVNYLLWGMYYCAIICLSLMCTDIFTWVREKLGIRQECIWYRIFCMVRTWCLVLVADVMVIAGSLRDLKIIALKLLYEFLPKEGVRLADAGWGRSDIVILAFGMVLLTGYSVMQEKGIRILDKIDARPLVVRWGIYYTVLFTVLLYGLYGMAYNAGEFLYMQF